MTDPYYLEWWRQRNKEQYDNINKKKGRRKKTALPEPSRGDKIKAMAQYKLRQMRSPEHRNDVVYKTDRLNLKKKDRHVRHIDLDLD